MTNNKTAAILMAVLYSGISYAAPAPVAEATAVITSQPASVTVATKSVTKSLESRLARVENILQARTKAQIETQQRLDELSTELMKLQGNIEESTLEQGKITQRQRDIMNDIERIRTLLVATPKTTAPVITDSVIIDAANTPDNKTGKDAYNYAIKLIKHERKYAQAVDALQNFIVDYPQSELSANAHYWLGLLLSKDKKVEAAKAQFEKIVLDYPESNKRADSLQKLGKIAKVAGLKEDAKRYFEMVIKQYPKNTAANLAKKELANLK